MIYSLHCNKFSLSEIIPEFAYKFRNLENMTLNVSQL